ncbi:MAG: hypothetical protein U0795_17435 [Pirellulales bacterium]
MNDDEPGIYHCCTQVVQQQWLFGYDALTGRDYGYRKEWIEEEFRRVARFMSIDILDYAAMVNHLHVMVNTRPDVSRKMSDREVAVRWCYLCRSSGLSREERNQRRRRPPRPTEKQVQTLLNDHLKLADCRHRLSSLSWMMRLVCQSIARRANKEAGTRGKFFASRFKSQQIEDEAGLLACSMYINMNPIRAGVVSDPEHAAHTSNYLRILSMVRSQADGNSGLRDMVVDPRNPDCWLAPVFLDPSAAAYQSVDDLDLVPVDYAPELSAQELLEANSGSDQNGVAVAEELAASEGHAASDGDGDLDAQDEVLSGAAGMAIRGPMFRGQLLVAEVFGPRLTNRGYLPISVDEYVNLAKWTAEQLLQSSPAKESSASAVVLDKVGLDAVSWPKTISLIGKCFSTSVGCADSLDRRAVQRGLKRLKGRNAALTAFRSGQAVAS